MATAALAKQFSNAVAPKRSGWRTFGKLLLAGALLGGVIVAIKAPGRPVHRLGDPLAAQLTWPTR